MLRRSRKLRRARAAECRSALRLLSLVALVAAALATVASSALAATGHRYTGQLGSLGGGAGDLAYPTGIAVDPSTGDIYVADAGDNRVQGYSPTGDATVQLSGAGTPATYFNGLGGLAVDGSAGQIYVTEQWNNVVDTFDSSGVYTGQLDPSATLAGAFNMPSAVAVDPATGDVYVADTGNNVVDVFDSAGAFQASFSATSPAGLAIDSSSNVYVLDSADQRVDEYTALGASLVGTLAASSPTAVATDPANDDVYVVESSPTMQVARFDSSGTRLEAFGAGRLSSPMGVAVSPTGHRVYVPDASTATVDIFSAYTAADVVTGGASGVTDSEATLDGTVNPQNGGDAWTYFEYGLDTNYGSTTNGVPVSNGNAAVPVTDTASFLQPNMTYHYRLTASTANGTVSGADATFTTAAIAPVVGGSVAYATAITVSDATLHATVNPNNSPTLFHFEYGTTTAYGATTPDDTAGAGYGDEDVSTPITGLQPATTYHFRVVADNGTGGPVNGADATFTTPPATSPSATDVTAVSATLEGGVSSSGSGWTYHFDYGPTVAYGSSTAQAPVVAGATSVSAPVTELEPSTSYHFRLVASNGATTVVSGDATFTTSPAPASTTGDVTDVGFSTATLHGTADTHGLAGTYRFSIVGVGNPVSRLTPEQALTSNGPVDVSGAVSDLPDKGTYEVRLVVTAAGAEARGDAKTFTTSAAPVLVPRSIPPNPNPYGCAAPHLADPAQPATPGKAYTLTGSDLGVGGTVTLGGVRARVDGWAAGAVTIEIPADAKGPLAVALNCGTAANAVTIAVAKPPSNAFTIDSAKVKGHAHRGVVTVTVPGAGVLRLGGTYLATVQKTLATGGTYRIGVKLNRKGVKRLGKVRKRRLRAGVAVRYTPTGGTAAADVAHLTFTRAKGRHGSKRH